ncbi:hypothetical protein [Nocardioides limicola]|uniref:hypothetical protein n=1 Tax=Nocardioides limicola TaxID=2803368 RepID=UPI00193B3704|nr:hypothetical protein [Nocardioides sp. DJM-14]
MEQQRNRRGVVTGVVGLVAGLLIAVSAPVAANHLNVKTSDLVNGAVTTPKLAKNAVKPGKIAKGAVRAPKIAAGAVRTGKLADGAVTTRKVAIGTDGVAQAGGQVIVQFANPVMTTSFNRFGAANPVVSTVGTGIYDVEIPGVSISGTAIYQVTPSFTIQLVNQVPTPLYNRHCTALPNQGKLRVRCWDNSGSAAHMGFTFLVVRR